MLGAASRVPAARAGRRSAAKASSTPHSTSGVRRRRRASERRSPTDGSVGGGAWSHDGGEARSSRPATRGGRATRRCELAASRRLAARARRAGTARWPMGARPIRRARGSMRSGRARWARSAFRMVTSLSAFSSARSCACTRDLEAARVVLDGVEREGAGKRRQHQGSQLSLRCMHRSLVAARYAPWLAGRGAGRPDRPRPASQAGCIGAHGRPQPGRARPRIGGDLLVRRAYRAMVNEPETRRRPCAGLRRQMARALLLRCRPFPEEALDQPILQRVEGDDGEPPARRQHALGRRQAARQLAELVVDVDAQRLERARGRVPAGDLLAPEHARGSCASSDVRANGLLLPPRDDRRGRWRASGAPRPDGTGCRRGGLPRPC